MVFPPHIVTGRLKEASSAAECSRDDINQARDGSGGTMSSQLGSQVGQTMVNNG